MQTGLLFVAGRRVEGWTQAKIGELMPAESKGGRGNQTVKQLNGFTRPTVTAYRKLAAYCTAVV
ncbi:MAG: hypothetical protein VB876_08340 [Pirellulales bacterium]